MSVVSWSGPRASWEKRLRARDVAIVSSSPIAIVSSAAIEAPRPPSRAEHWIWLAERPLPHEAIRATMRGAYDVIDSTSPDALERLLQRIEELSAPQATLPQIPEFVAKSDAAKQLLRQILKAARTSLPVLLTGETGSGKELAARLLHATSRQDKGPFVPVNCAAIPNELMEAELFGYSKGAFSGAVQRFEGRLMSAEGGTVFLDEIDDTPISTQNKLLRVLEDRVVTRLGELEPRRVDFRIVAATNRDLRPLIASGQFGADFYERLAIITVQLPPLRDRREDLPELAAQFLARFQRDDPSARDRPSVDSISDGALAALAGYHWPGNARELRNVIFEALAYKRGGRVLLLSDLPQRILTGAPATPRSDRLIDEAELARRIDLESFDLTAETEQLERAALQLALARSNGNAARAARLLGTVGRGAARDPGSTVRAMMRRLDVRRRPLQKGE